MAQGPGVAGMQPTAAQRLNAHGLWNKEQESHRLSGTGWLSLSVLINELVSA